MESELRVLIVEDDLKFRKLLELRLRAWRKDLRILTAESIKDAKAILSSEVPPFHLVVLDQHLPDGMSSVLFEHPRLKDSAVLAVSADDTPELPAQALRAGAQHFLGKRQISEPLFLPLIQALIERKQIEQELFRLELHRSKMETIRTLLSTLQHEINNPLGAVFGAAYILRSGSEQDEEQKEATRLIEESGKRIKHVLNQLCDAAELEEVIKGKEKLYQVPGDPDWES